MARNRELCPVAGGDERDADVAGGRGRPAAHRPAFEEAAANVAEYYDIPLATLHFFPMRANGQVLPFLPAPLGRAAMTASSGWVGASIRRRSRTGSAVNSACRRQRPRAAKDRRARIAGDTGLRRGLLPRAGRRMGEWKASGPLSAR